MQIETSQRDVIKGLLVECHLELRQLDKPKPKTQLFIYNLLGEILLQEDDEYMTRYVPDNINKLSGT